MIRRKYFIQMGCLTLCIACIQLMLACDNKIPMKIKAQEKTNATPVYKNTSFHEPVQIDPNKLKQSDEVKNIILFIGDGMGVAQMFAGMTANHGKLNLEYLKYIGLSKTQSFNKYVTDSAAGGTAIATGANTYYGAVGVNSDTVKVPSILELAEAKGLSTGMVTTCDLTDATPAAFVAHQKSRYMLEEVARDYLNTDVDIVIGGGLNYFANRSDGQSLLPFLEERDYTIITDIAELSKSKDQKIFALIADKGLPRAIDRRSYLTSATKIALSRLEQNDKGFFLMIEGSQIDWAGHENHTGHIIEEVLDLDRAIGVALEFAADKGQTLIICTADHETGGMSLESGNVAAGELRADYTGGDHTGVMVPVYSIGPGAEEFIGIYENTVLFDKMTSLLDLK